MVLDDPAAPRIGTDALAAPLDLAAPIRDLWRTRLGTVLFDSYAGVPLRKFPEDLRVYEHLLWAGRIDVVIELGTAHGGSALWFRDRMQSFQEHGRCAGSLVVSVDLDLSLANEHLPANAAGIELIEGMHDPALPERVAATLPAGARCLVVEDGPHTYEATTAALSGFARFVPRGGWFVVEDGAVDEERLRIDNAWPRGVERAVRGWLGTPAGVGFELRRDFEAYGLTCNCNGYLRRRP